MGQQRSKKDVVVELLGALKLTEREPDLAAVIVDPLRNVISAYMVEHLIGALNRAVAGFGAGDAGEPLKRVEALLKILVGLLDKPVCRELCVQFHPGCKDTLAALIVRHPNVHEVQSFAQWGLALLAGMATLYQTVVQVGESTTAMKAFFWTTAETCEQLPWNEEWQLAEHAVHLVKQYPDDAEMQLRCFQFLGARLDARKLSSSKCGPAEHQRRRQCAAGCVQVLAIGVATWLRNLTKEGRRTAFEASEALSLVCGSKRPGRGLNLEESPIDISYRYPL